ncbi:MAG: UbiD family decarboxylase [Deltaproteobacteria bacterium]|nr:UbiD family decarboxylase [Deltaproteobacteria bacterium]
MIEDLRKFLEILRREKEIVEVSTQVDPYLEAAEIHRRVIDSAGPALLFTNIKGAAFPLVTNLFGTQRRMDLAFGPRPERIVQAAARLPETLFPPSLGKLWQHRSLLADLAKVGMKRRSHGAVTENIDTPARLTRLPLLTTWEEDGGPFITLPLVYTEHPETHIPNLGMYRMQRFDDDSTGFHCQIGKGAGFHLAAAKALGKKLPVNVHIGGPPALILSAIAPLPENVPELLLASLVVGKRLEMSRNPLGPLNVAANAEFVLVGEVDPAESRPEGPFGDHYGYYSLKHDYPVFRCKGVLRRRDAIFTATVVGKPKQEDFFIGDYLQKLLSPLFPLVMPAVSDLWSYGETGYHSLATAVVKQRYKREAMASAFRILGEGQLSLTKFLLVVDRPMDIHNFKATLEFVLERFDPRCDLYIFSNLSMDTLDYTGPRVNEGSKGVLLGVGDPIRELPNTWNSELPPQITKARPFCRGCLVIQGTSFASDPQLAEVAAKLPCFAAWPLVVLVDNAEQAVSSQSNFLWTTFTRFEPGADITCAQKHIVRNHIAYEGPIVIDARMKPNYPAELFCDEKTSALVDRRWKEYFPNA